MLKYILVEETATKLMYRYYPEGDEEFGIVCWDKETKMPSVIKLSSEDPHRIYALKMFSEFRKFAQNNVFEKEGMIAWY